MPSREEVERFNADLEDLTGRLFRVLANHIDEADPAQGYDPQVVHMTALTRVQRIIWDTADQETLAAEGRKMRDAVFATVTEKEGTNGQRD